jgi:hypothetical protein
MCLRKEAGDSCDGGECTVQKCGRSRPGPDGKIVETSWDCLKCTPAVGGGADTVRIAIGTAVALLVIGGGVWLAKRKLAA